MGNIVSTPAELKAEILRLTREYSRQMHEAQRPGYERGHARFTAGETVVPYAGRVFTEDEVEAGVSSMLDFWLTLGKEGEEFEERLAQFLGVKKTILVNSGSSANLVAFSALTSHKLPDEKRVRPGDEIITCAAGFPTTVAPIIQNGAVPVFIDNDPVTGNADVRMLEEAYTPGKTKAVMFAHTLGNPFDLNAVLNFCAERNLSLIEDNCDALGCTYTRKLPDGSSVTRLTGTWGDLSTQSFYPPHHLTLGEGGAVNIVGKMQFKVLVESFRDWGRDCWCASGKENTCNKRFGWQLGELPERLRSQIYLQPPRLQSEAARSPGGDRAMPAREAPSVCRSAEEELGASPSRPLGPRRVLRIFAADTRHPLVFRRLRMGRKRLQDKLQLVRLHDAR